MNKLPPFDPPYLTLHDEGDCLRVVETLADGNTRTHPSREKSLPAPTVAKDGSQSTAAPGKPGNKRAALFLKVPFSEKDQAKAAGAKWDAQARKWYVPQGMDIAPFSPWWPEDVKPS